MLTLGIETSCDDTSICILKKNDGGLPEVLSHQSFSSEILLKKWGGVVPEIAARNHLEKIAPLLESSLEKAGVKLSEINSNSPALLSSTNIKFFSVSLSGEPILRSINSK